MYVGSGPKPFEAEEIESQEGQQKGSSKEKNIWGKREAFYIWWEVVEQEHLVRRHPGYVHSSF
jgi:hypothetical protein